MKVIFYYNMSDSRTINKRLVEPLELDGTMRDETDIKTPIVRVRSNDTIRQNYAYIPELQRYYTVSDKNIYRTGIYDISLEVDPLMSFRGDIVELYCVVDKQTMRENGDEYIDDSSLVTDNLMFSTVYNYPNGFNNSPELILITAG